MKHKTLICLFLASLLMGSCKSVHTLGKSAGKNPTSIIKKAGIQANAKWYKTLENSKVAVKNEWMRFKGYDFDNIEKMYGIKLNMQELEKLIFIPVLSYRLSPSAIASIKASNSSIQTSKPIKDSLTLYENNAFFFVLKDDVLTFAIWLDLKDSEWKLKEWSRAGDSISKRFSEYYLEKNMPFIDVQVPFTGNYAFHFCVVIDKHGELIDIGADGSTQPFIESIKEF